MTINAIREALEGHTYTDLERSVNLLRFLKALVAPFTEADPKFETHYESAAPRSEDNDAEFEAAMTRLELILKLLSKNNLYAYTLPSIEDGGELALED